MSPSNRGIITLRREHPELLGDRPSRWRSFIELHAPILEDTGDVLSLGDEYFLSLGAHATHGLLLMDRRASTPLTVEVAFRLAALISFAFDAPCTPVYEVGAPARMRPVASGTFSSAFHRRSSHSLGRYLEGLKSLADECTELFTAGAGPRRRIVAVIPEAAGKWPYIELPRKQETWRALSAYWSGLLALSIPGRILNFWRAVEASTRTRSEREMLFSRALARRVRAVPYRVGKFSSSGHRDTMIDAVGLLRATALRRRDELVAVHGQPVAALDDLYWMRRGKAAHADQNALEYDQLGSLPEQIGDSQLLRYLARIAIERNWR